MSKIGVNAKIVNIPAELNFRNKRFSVPSIKSKYLTNLILALLQYNWNWKNYFYRTTYAFNLMTKIAEKYIQKNVNNFDLILQSGVLFSASFRKLGIPYFLYLDNTTAIYEKYFPVKGLPNPKIASKKWKKMEKNVYDIADVIFTMSNFVKNSLAIDYKIPKNKIKVVGAGPNIDTIPKSYDKVYTENNILFVGKNFEAKGGNILLKSFQQVRKKIHDACLIIVGPKERIKGPGIIYKGWVASKDMPEIYSKSSLFVLPTLREAFGLSFLEAMAHQLPCIGTNIQSIPEMISEGKNGFLVPTFNEAKLAEKIILILENKKLKKRMGLAGYRKIIEFYNWKSVVSKIIFESKKHI
jgi:glycosyltransferase involved in cell wall biosynthesis